MAENDTCDQPQNFGTKACLCFVLLVNALY